MAFTFKHGDRPLGGYTVQRGVGRGGFGEVYYAVSDGGREVALKYLRDNPQVELRGVAHCINLKSPHLVNIFDVKQNDDGEYFVIMEYVSGPSLRDLLIAEPNGLGYQKAAFFIREIAKGLRYLHDRGIVHRDMKPGNVFYDDGYVKIGDYGLSKFISTSQHSAQTTSVGTVHYMAPEVGSGNYSRGIDVYALGVMLYEMLLGKVPYEGSSMGEVLMKHLTAQPELDELPAPFAEVIRKSLAKDPAERYQTVDEMVDALFIEDDLAQSVAGFNPNSLSQAVQRGTPEIAGTPPHGFGTPPPPPPPPPPPYTEVENKIEKRINQVMQHGTLTPEQLAAARTDVDITTQMRVRSGILMFLTLGSISGAVAMLMVILGAPDDMCAAGFLTTALLSSAVLGSNILVRKLGEIANPPWIQKLFLMGLGGFALFVGMAPMWDASRYEKDAFAVIWAMIALLFLVDWPRRLRIGREGKMSISTMIGPGFLAWFVWAITGGFGLGVHGESGFLAVAITIATLAIVQASGWFKPWIVPPMFQSSGSPIRGYPYDFSQKSASKANVQGPAPQTQDTPQGSPHPEQPEASKAAAEPQVTAKSNPPAGIPLEGDQPDAVMASEKPIPGRRWAISRAFWGVLSFCFFAISVTGFTSLDIQIEDQNFRPLILLGAIASAALCIYSLTKITERRRKGFFSETIRPLLICICIIGLSAPIVLDQFHVIQHQPNGMTVYGNGAMVIPTGLEVLITRAVPIIFGGLLLFLLATMLYKPGASRKTSISVIPMIGIALVGGGFFLRTGLGTASWAVFGVMIVILIALGLTFQKPKQQKDGKNNSAILIGLALAVVMVLLVVGYMVVGVRTRAVHNAMEVEQSAVQRVESMQVEKKLHNAFSRYRLDVGKYPSDLMALFAPTSDADPRLWKGPYLDESFLTRYAPGGAGTGSFWIDNQVFQYNANFDRSSYKLEQREALYPRKYPLAEAAVIDVETALQAYRQDVGSYPTTEQGLLALITCPEVLPNGGSWNGPYIQCGFAQTLPGGMIQLDNQRFKYHENSSGGYHLKRHGIPSVSSSSHARSSGMRISILPFVLNGLLIVGVVVFIIRRGQRRHSFVMADPVASDHKDKQRDA